MRKSLLLSAAILAVPVSASADFVTANKVVRECRDVFDRSRGLGVFQQGYCLGVVTGIFYLGPSLNKDHTFCAPQGADNAQGVLIVSKYMENNPEKLHEPFN